MGQIQTQLPTETWINASWEDYLQMIENPVYEKAKSYYHDRRMRIEMLPVGNAHSRDHGIVIYAVYIFAVLAEIDLDGHDNCSYRKQGLNEAQPDASFYIGTKSQAIPWSTGIIDLNVYPPPDLVIEIAYSSLLDDRGEKRLLYEAMNVREYWIIDVQNAQLIAFAIENGGSRRITQSLVLPGLDLSLLEKALRRSRETNHTQVGAWLLAQFQQR